MEQMPVAVTQRGRRVRAPVRYEPGGDNEEAVDDFAPDQYDDTEGSEVSSTVVYDSDELEREGDGDDDVRSFIVPDDDDDDEDGDADDAPSNSSSGSDDEDEEVSTTTEYNDDDDTRVQMQFLTSHEQ